MLIALLLSCAPAETTARPPAATGEEAPRPPDQPPPEDATSGGSTPGEPAADSTDGDAASDEQPADPAFEGSIEPLPEEVRAAMTGVTWREGCPVGLDELSLLTLSHWDFEGEVRIGRLIVATKHARDMVGVFEALFEARFPVRRMRPAYEYGGSDDASMADDNTSAFNCRAVTGGSSYSEHSYGHAIDINTVENPYVSGDTVLPAEGAAYVDREDERPGMILPDGPVVAAFAAIGWGWGGDWTSLKDYQHFSATGR